MRIIFGALLLSLSALSSFAACTSEFAEYRSLEDKNFMLSFAKQKNPKAWSNIQVTLKTPKQKLDFEFTASNGYSIQYLVLLNDGIEDSEDNIVDFFDKKLKIQLLPQVGHAAPEYVFAPKLGLWLNYTDAKHQEYLPRGIFKFDHCRK
jgi:hypothetical protein